MKAKPATICRTVFLFAALAIQLLLRFSDRLPFLGSPAFENAIQAFTVIAALICWWKNNSFSDCAILADQYLKEFRSGFKNLDHLQIFDCNID